MSDPESPGGPARRWTVAHGDPVAVVLTAGIHGGDLDALLRLLAERPELASGRMIGRQVLAGGLRGHRAAAANAAPPSTSSHKEPISTGCPTTPRRPHWMRQAPGARSERTSSAGCESAAPLAAGPAIGVRHEREEAWSGGLCQRAWV